ncbi:MAG: hypothetical protein IJL03_04610 [Lachnospiraceae bacterium]|nr:hypothetical protein [Lachnospiraceae bacterium]
MSETNEQNGMNRNPEPVKTAKKFPVKIIIYILIIAALAGGIQVYRYFMRFDPTFEVNGQEFGLQVTVGDLEKLGMTLCQPDGTIIDSGSMKMNAKSTMVNSYYIGVPNGDHADLTGFKVSVVNIEKDAATYTDCYIRTIDYVPEKQSPAVSVKICGIDFSQADRKNIKEYVKKAGIPFKEAKVDAFMNDKSDTAEGKRGKVGFSLARTDKNVSVGFTRKDIGFKYGR